MTPDPATDPAGYVLAVADLREQRAKAATPGPWTIRQLRSGYVVSGALREDGRGPWLAARCGTAYGRSGKPTAEHIAAEASPDHALAEAALWRGIAERHTGAVRRADCDYCGEGWPCPDLLDAVAAAKAYATNPAQATERRP